MLAFGVTLIRERIGYREAEPIPTTFPSRFLDDLFPKISYIHACVCILEAPKTASAGLRTRGVIGRHERCVQARPEISICPRRQKHNNRITVLKETQLFLFVFFPFFGGFFGCCDMSFLILET